MPRDEKTAGSTIIGGLKRRGIIRFGTLAAALTGASTLSGLLAGSANAAPGTDKNPPTSYIPSAEKGAAAGVATLDGNGKLPSGQVPDLSLAVAAEVSIPGKAARDALDGLFAPSFGSTFYADVESLEPNAQRWGAVGDNVSRPLSTIFGSLEEARTRYPSATALTDELDWAALQSCIDVKGGVYIPKPATGYRINRPLTIKNQWLYGHRGLSRIFQHTNNTPILDVQTGADVSYVRLTYVNPQPNSNTNADAIRLFNVGNGSKFTKIRIDFPARGIFNYGGGYTYSTHFSDISIGYYSITAFDIRNSGGITGNLVKNLYTHNNPMSESATNSSSEPPVQIAGWDDGVLEQINIEHTKASAAISISANNITVSGLHVEGFTLLGNFNAPINLYGSNTQLTISGYSVVFCKFLVENITLDNSFALFKITDGVRVVATGIQERNNTITASGAAFVFNSSGTTSGMVIADAVKLNGFGGNTAGDTTKVSTIARLNNNCAYDSQNGKYTLFQDAAPTRYTWNVGDRVQVRNPTEAGSPGSKYITIGYICIASGTPGVWVPLRSVTGN